MKTNEQLQIRVHGAASRPAIVYLPGMHGDWTLIPSFRAHAPETMAELPEFLARRTEEDRQAAVHRLGLMLANDLRPLAAATTIPVFAISGAVDPVVPWLPVFRSLRKHCPRFRESKVVWAADHNVLNSVQRAADCVFSWIWRERALCLAS